MNRGTVVIEPLSDSKRDVYMRSRGVLAWCVALGAMGWGGCVTPDRSAPIANRVELKQRALECVKAAVRYEHNPVVRIEAVEALQADAAEEVYPWIRTALTDDHSAVRFSASVAAGTLRDDAARTTLRSLLDDDNPSVRVAATYALHRLGDTSHSGLMPTVLLEDADPTVRRNAALVLGLLDDQGAVKVLARAMKDPDAGVRHHVLEALARLGNRDASQELLFMTNAGVGAEEVFAVTALANTRSRRFADMFAYKLDSAPHLETRLAAARGLGLLGDDRGFDQAISALSRERPTSVDRNDPPEDQVLRIRQLAAGALGAIGRVDALPALSLMMERQADPRLQVSAAKAILEILQNVRVSALSFDGT